MAKKVGMQYVDEFSFPAEQGFTGSAGKEPVKGYMRGGRVKATHETANANRHRAPGPGASHGGAVKARSRRKASGADMPANVKAHGGEVEYAEGGTVGVTTPRRGKSMPQQASQTKAAKKSTKKAGGGSVHDQLYAAGEEMGYMRGGHVKNTSPEFVQTTGKQDSMDHGVQPAQKGRSRAEKEAGGNKPLKAGYMKGGDVHAVRRKASKKGMPKGVKARGGLARYAEGGMSVDVLGKGALAKSARAARTRAENLSSTVDEALAGQQAAERVQDRPPRPAAKKTAARKPAPGSERGKRPHYGMPFQSSPMIK